MPDRRYGKPGSTDDATVRELVLWGQNDATVYRQSYEPIVKNLQGKLASGKYNHALAVKLWRYWADAAAKSYTKEFDVHPRSSFGIFTVADRNEAAEAMAWEFEIESRVQTGGLQRTTVRGKTRLAPKSGTWMFS